MKAESESPVALFKRAIERWENEGGRVAEFGRKRAANPGSVPGVLNAGERVRSSMREGPDAN